MELGQFPIDAILTRIPMPILIPRIMAAVSIIDIGSCLWPDGIKDFHEDKKR